MSSACIMVRLAPDLAAQFPAARAGEGPPHVTVAYVSEADERVLADVSAALRTAALVEGPFSLALTGGVHLFPANAEGEAPVCIAVQSEGLLAFRRRFLAALAATQPAVADVIERAHGGYVPHATVRYALPGGSTEVDPRPRGGMIVDAVELWAGDELREVVGIKPATPRPIALSAVSLDARPLPKGVTIFNPGGYHQGTPFRTASAGTVVYDVGAGHVRVELTKEHLVDAARVFAARASMGEFRPRINFGHQPDNGAEAPVFFGEVIGMYVADDGSRGPGLYVVPGWTDRGAEYARIHMSPNGASSLLSSSPELRFGERYARSEGDGVTGRLLGHTEAVGIALTEYPAQSDRDIDRVVLDGHPQHRSGAAAGGPMKPKTNLTGAAAAPVGAALEGDATTSDTQSTIEAIVARQDATDAKIDRVTGMLDQLLQRMAPPAAEGGEAVDATDSLEAEGGKADDEEEKAADMEASLAAALTAAQRSKDPAARALAAALTAEKSGAAAATRQKAERENEARIRTLEQNLAAEKAQRFEDRAKAEVESLIQAGLVLPAERELRLRQFRAAHAENLSADAKPLQETAKATWDAFVAEARKAGPKINLSAKGVNATEPAKGDKSALVQAIEDHAKSINLDANTDFKSARQAFARHNPDEYERLARG